MRTPSRQHELWLEHLLARARLLLVAGTLVAAYLLLTKAGAATIASRLLATFILFLVVAAAFRNRRQRQLSAEVEIVAKALGCVRDARTYVTAVGAVAEQLTQVFDATSVIIAIESPAADRYCWTVLRGANMSPEVRSLDASRNPVDHSVLDGPEPQTVLFRRDDSRPGLACIGSAPMLTRASRVPDAPFWKIVDCDTVLEHSITLDGGWQVRVYVPNPGRARSDIQTVQLLHTFGTQIAPALLKLFLTRRLRKQAIARERARLSRELHDRVVQSLIALEIKVAVLSRSTAARPIAPELEELRTALQAEIAEVRDLMQDLRPLRLKGADVPAFIEEMVARFGTTTGIETRFECELETVELLPHSCGELARLVQEALANVRKHSGATKVAVSLTRAANSLVLTVHDNGRGFDFAGRMAAHTLPPRERPRMIEERARAIGASFSIESIPGSGARLDVTLPYAS